MGAEGSKPAAAAAAGELPGIVTVRSAPAYDQVAASSSSLSLRAAAAGEGGVQGEEEESERKRCDRTPVETLVTLQTFQPLLPAVPEPSWKELIPRNPLAPGEPTTGVIDASTTNELLDLYVRWCREAIAELSKNQESVHRGVEDAEARAERLLQWLAQAARSTTKSAKDLQQVHALQSELAEAQRRLDNVLVSYEKLCGRLEGARGRIR